MAAKAVGQIEAHVGNGALGVWFWVLEQVPGGWSPEGVAISKDSVHFLVPGGVSRYEDREDALAAGFQEAVTWCRENAIDLVPVEGARWPAYVGFHGAELPLWFGSGVATPLGSRAFRAYARAVLDGRAGLAATIRRAIQPYGGEDLLSDMDVDPPLVMMSAAYQGDELGPSGKGMLEGTCDCWAYIPIRFWPRRYSVVARCPNCGPWPPQARCRACGALLTGGLGPNCPGCVDPNAVGPEDPAWWWHLRTQRRLDSLRGALAVSALHLGVDRSPLAVVLPLLTTLRLPDPERIAGALGAEGVAGRAAALGMGAVGVYFDPRRLSETVRIGATIGASEDSGEEWSQEVERRVAVALLTAAMVYHLGNIEPGQRQPADVREALERTCAFASPEVGAFLQRVLAGEVEPPESPWWPERVALETLMVPTEEAPLWVVGSTFVKSDDAGWVTALLNFWRGALRGAALLGPIPLAPEAAWAVEVGTRVFAQGLGADMPDAPTTERGPL
jgi:hypothetical protein